MAYEVLIQTPDTPITEKWVWRSDVIVADDGSEQRISTMALPRRSWNGNLSFGTEAEIRRHVATMFAKFGTTFKFPIIHMGVFVKSRCDAGFVNVYCNTARSDFRPGSAAFMQGKNGSEIVIIDEIFADHVSLIDPLVNSYPRGSNLCPLATVYSSDGAAIVRRPVNSYATATYTYFEYGFLSPFIEEADEADLQMFGGYPVLNRRGIGADFNQQLFTGLEITDYGGIPALRSRWNSSKFAMPLTFKSERGLDPLDWNYWRTFADYCRGSVNPFYLPTFRDDFDVLTDVASGGSTFVSLGHEYADNWFADTNFRKIVITKPDGTEHFASITAVANSAGNDLITFAPAVAAGDWADHSVSFVLKCRIADDTFSIEHRELESRVTLNIRSVDE